MNKILLIDDDQFFQKFYSTKLTENGYSVSIAQNGEDGVEMMKKERFDLLLLDLVMPKMDGFEVLKTLSKDEGLRNMPVIVFSTLGMDNDIEEAKKLGAKDYVSKRFSDFEELLNKIRSFLKH